MYVAVEVETASAPDETTAAQIEPLVVTCDDAQSTDVPDAFHEIVVAPTVCQWSSVNKTATVQIANPSGGHVHLERIMILGCISPVKSVLAQNVNTIHNGSAKSDSAREELRTALKDSSNNTTFWGTVTRITRGWVINRYFTPRIAQ